MEESPWLRLLQRVAFNAWVGIATAVRKHSSGIVLKDRMELGSIDWLRRRAFSEDRLARNILGELRDETDKLHNAIEDLDFKVRSSQSLQLLRCCWRLWCHGRPWCETALLPLAMRHWLSLALVRWAVLTRKRQVPRWTCGRRLMLQEALSCRIVWTCFAAWHLAFTELSANAIQGQLLRCVKALGAFDVQLLQLCPEITGQGLAALQVQCVDLGKLLQEHLSNVKLNISRPPVGFPCRRFRYFLLLRRVSFFSWRKKAAQMRKERGPWLPWRPLLRLAFNTWRYRSSAMRVAPKLLRRRQVRRQLWMDWSQLEREQRSCVPQTMFEYSALSLLHVP